MNILCKDGTIRMLDINVYGSDPVVYRDVDSTFVYTQLANYEDWEVIRTDYVGETDNGMFATSVSSADFGGLSSGEYTNQSFFWSLPPSIPAFWSGFSKCFSTNAEVTGDTPAPSESDTAEFQLTAGFFGDGPFDAYGYASDVFGSVSTDSLSFGGVTGTLLSLAWYEGSISIKISGLAGGDDVVLAINGTDYPVEAYYTSSGILDGMIVSASSPFAEGESYNVAISLRNAVAPTPPPVGDEFTFNITAGEQGGGGPNTGVIIGQYGSTTVDTFDFETAIGYLYAITWGDGVLEFIVDDISGGDGFSLFIDGVEVVCTVEYDEYGLYAWADMEFSPFIVGETYEIVFTLTNVVPL